jgi:hypothetical protein
MKSKTLPLKNTFTRFTFLAITIFACLFLGQSLNAQTLTATVNPAANCEASTGNNFTFTFTKTSGSYAAGSQVSLVIPAGWTAPQTLSATSPGYVTVTTPTGGGSAAAIISPITGTGPWTILINITITASGNQTFTLTYGGGGTGVTAPTAGLYTFTTQASSGGAFTPVSNPPTITVNPVIAANTITADQTICTSTTPTSLSGSTPTGGSGTYGYQWQSSTTGAVGTFIRRMY